MKSRAKVSLLAAAVASVFGAAQANASFNYDLRFAPGQQGVTDAHDATLSSNGVITNAGIYTLQLWGQITGDTNLTNDGFPSGYVNVQSSNSGGAAIGTGMGITGATLGSHVNNAVPGSASVGSAGSSDINGDGVMDWGTTATTSTAAWLKWAGNGPAPATYSDGSADAESEQVNANTWEVLLATFTVNTSILASGGNTTFLTGEVPAIKSGLGSVATILYYQDGANVTDTSTVTNSGVTFKVLASPEPASLGVLALGALGLLARRRK